VRGAGVLSPPAPHIDRGAKRQFYAVWRALLLDAYRHTGGAYGLAQRMEAAGPVALPPFNDLALVPAVI
jgi:hypothetical protein